MALEMLSRMNLERLVDLFEETTNSKEPHIPTVRGWLMDAIEAKNPEGFDAWLESALASDEDLRDFVLHADQATAVEATIK